VIAGRLADQIAIITGAASGFGRGTAEVFAQEGALVVLADINREAAEGVADGIRRDGGEAVSVACDVTDSDQIQGVVDTALGLRNRIDILYNNAGIPMAFTPIEEVDEQQWDRIMAVNAKGVFLGCRAVVPLMKSQGGGVILNTASTAAVRPRPGLTPYNASKGAVEVLTKSLALELAPYRIRVNAVNPVAGETPMLEGFIGSRDPEQLRQGRERFRESIPLGRLCSPRDVANAALYLCSDAACFITGVCLDVDGGRDV
jgi:3-oxoacyl-[acyl-carrier protein] reductase